MSALLLAVFFIWKNTLGRQIEVSNNSPSENAISDHYLKEAKEILNHFSAHTDQYGFYGLMQECEKVNSKYECKVKMEKLFNREDGESRAAWRDGLKVIWARFQYYQATGDQEELARLEQDLDNLITKVVDNETTVLQSGDFTCLYLMPIIQSADVSLKTRDQAKRLCLESTIEYAPLSSLIFSQYQRHVVVITGHSGDDENFPIVGTMQELIPEDRVHVYTKEEITEQINTNLAAIAEYGPYESYSFGMPMREQPKFFQREAAAAVDQIFKMKLAQQEGETEIYNLAEIEYLLLIDELFSWYMANMLELDDNSICLFDQAINYYFHHYSNPLTQDDINFYRSYYWDTDNPELTCQLAHLTLSPQYNIDKESLKAKITNLGAPDWNKGLMHQIKDQTNLYYYPTSYNGLLAGFYAYQPSDFVDEENNLLPEPIFDNLPQATDSAILENTKITMEEN